MTLAALRRLPSIRHRVHLTLDRNLERVAEYFEREERLRVWVPEGGNVAFPRLPRSVDAHAFANRLLDRYSTVVVPGHFFESPRHFRISYGCRPALLDLGLRSISRALDDLM